MSRGSRLSDELERWSTGENARTLGSLVEAFQEKSFAVLFVVLLGVPALPIPTGGATHVFEAIAMVLAVELLAGRREVWLPRRWRDLRLAGQRRERLIERLVRLIRWLERRSRTRGRRLFGHRLSNPVFGALVLGGSLTAFVAPPFSGLDTLPALGVVLLSLGVLLEDVVVVAVALAVGAGGIGLVALLGSAALQALEDLAWVTSTRTVTAARSSGRPRQ